jgi:nicotinate-nucleotide adenylyltransferase
MTKTKLGLYGGSFDPVHNGHLILARQALEDLGLDRIIFVPAAESPFKLNQHATLAAHRVKMIELAIEPETAFSIDTLEIDRPPPSYTIDTVRTYRERFPVEELFFLVGEDHVNDLPKWNHFAELDGLIQFAVLVRSDLPLSVKYPVVRRRLDLSSTEIRNRVANHLPISYLVPDSVLEYIGSNHLYEGADLSSLRS